MLNFFKKLFSARAGSGKNRFYVFYVKCKRCGEVIEGHVNLVHDLSVDYDSGSEIYHCRKVMMGDGKNLCYQQIEVFLSFSPDKTLLERSIHSGADFVNEAG